MYRNKRIAVYIENSRVVFDAAEIVIKNVAVVAQVKKATMITVIIEKEKSPRGR